MKLAFCTTCKGRTAHLLSTLPRNLPDNPDADARFIVLNYRNSPDGLDDCLRAHHQMAIDSGRLSVYRFPIPGPFQMAHAKNMVHRLGIMEGAELLVNLDADNFTGPGFARYVSQTFRYSAEPMFMWAKMVKDGPDRLPRGCNGRIAVSRSAFVKSGGYDERFDTWSPDDKDFNARLRRLGYQGVEIDHQYLGAILHNDKLRFKEYPQAENQPNGEDSFAQVEHSDATIANWGDFGTGTVYRVGYSEPVEIKRLPTRIFGIGLHKTATTSLHEAFTILGYESAHWITAHWARAIWEEMKTARRSKTLEQHYALCDLPIPLLFRDLDQAYPGSKFILTIRNETEWLESVRKHFSWHNRFHAQWDHDPFSHRVHTELYGRRKFDAEIFLQRYRRHTAEVLDYFRDRPDDLLVMNMSDSAGWYELCGFLAQPIPSVPYPWRISNS
jgi:hypothetical protein